MNDRKLQRKVERISESCFGLPFRHQARYNHRLRSTGGRYFPHNHQIEINPKYWVQGQEAVEGIIKHELCHYHLHLAGKGYHHRDRDFKQLLARVDAPRFCKPMTEEKSSRPYRYRLTCHSCQTVYDRKKWMDPVRYRCGKCRGRLRIKRIEEK